MKKRITVSLSMFVDLKAEEGADISNIINRLDCKCIDKSGEAEVIDVEITDRSLVVEDEEETDTE